MYYLWSCFLRSLAFCEIDFKTNRSSEIICLIMTEAKRTIYWHFIFPQTGVFYSYFSRILEYDNFMTRISLVFWWVLGPAIPKLWVFGARWDPGTPDSNGVGVQWDCRMHIFLVLWNTTILLLLTWFESNWAPNPTLYLCPWCTSIFLVFGA